jgi:prophage regulatory protein
MKQLPEEGFVKLKDVLEVYTVSKSTWYRGIEEGEYPKPVKISKGRVGWKVADIRALINNKSLAH